VNARRAWPSPDGEARDDRLPAFAAPLAGDLLDGVRPGERVLDVGSRRPGTSAYPDGAFDVVVWRHGLQLMHDRSTALADMRRVLAPGGRAAVAVGGPIERNPAFAALADSLEHRVGAPAAAAVRWLFCLPQPEELQALLAFAGFDSVRVRTDRRTARFPSVAEFLRRYLPGSPAGSAIAHIPDGDTWDVVADLETDLRPWFDAGGLRITTEANIGLSFVDGLRRSSPRS
jgi:SAM-dependent methyltransferase